MVVYIEYVLLDNFIIDFIILYCVGNVLKLQKNYLRIILASLVGVAFAFTMPYIVLYNIVLFIIKLLMGVIIIFICYKFNNVKSFFLAYTLFIFLTFLLGGICYGLQSFVQTPIVTGNSITYNNSFPISLVVLSVFVFFILFKNLYNSIKLKQKIAIIDIFFQNKKLTINALIDSGNQLLDTQTKLPISFLDRQDFIKTFGQINFKEDLTYENLLCKTISGSKLLDTILVDKLIINKKITFLNARIALYDFDKKNNYKAIISNNLIC